MMDDGKHSRHGLDDVIHAPVRLPIMAALAQMEVAEFRFLRDAIEVSDSLLSKHLTALESTGYVLVVKRGAGRRARTWVSLTSAGREAFTAYKKLLRKIVRTSN